MSWAHFPGVYQWAPGAGVSVSTRSGPWGWGRASWWASASRGVDSRASLWDLHFKATTTEVLSWYFYRCSVMIHIWKCKTYLKGKKYFDVLSRKVIPHKLPQKIRKFQDELELSLDRSIAFKHGTGQQVPASLSPFLKSFWTGITSLPWCECISSKH